MTRLFIALLALCVAGFPSFTLAQVQDWRTDLAQSDAAVLDFGDVFEGNTNRQLQIYFTVEVPRGGPNVTVQSRLPDIGSLYEVRYVSPEGQLLEYLTISSGTIAPPTPDLTHKDLFNVIEQFAYPSIEFPADAEVLGGRISDFNGLTALEFMAIRRVEGEATFVARIMGVVSPNGVDTLFFIQQTASEPMGLQHPDEMAETYAGSVSGSVVFNAYRDGAGALIPF